jgi:predicted nucleotide-binding protein (sugar kinase/HSP70/actin superfamily)
MHTQSNIKPIKLYIPRMSYSSARVTAAAFQSIGFDAHPSPETDARTMELGAKYLSGDECLPEKITLGNFLKIIEAPDFDPEYTGFLMPTAGGPCRFGQYRPLFQKILREKELHQVRIFSPTSSDGYAGFGDQAKHLFRTTWHALIVGDILRKLHLRTRPYEITKGSADALFQVCLDDICQVLAHPTDDMGRKIKLLRRALIDVRDRYRALPADYSRIRPLIGIVGEIYCRLDDDSNNHLVDKIEEFGGEVWMSDIVEWAWYTNDEQRWKMARSGKRFSKEMLVIRLKQWFMRRDEHYLMAPFKHDFMGYEEPTHVRDILKLSRPYLPRESALGEMVLNVGKAIYLYKKGADGIIDISPFSCMNGIVCEVVYRQVSTVSEHFPIRNFYFDGNQTDLDRDVGIFMELAKNYMRKKTTARRFPIRD